MRKRIFMKSGGMKKVIVFSLAACLLVSILGVYSCKGEGGGPTGETVTLKFHYAFVGGSIGEVIPDFWIPEIEKRTDGRVKIEFYPGGALGTMRDAPTMVKSGTVDIAYVGAADAPGSFPLFEFVHLPFTASSVDFTRVLTDVYKEGWFDKELAENNVRLASFSLKDPYQILMHDKKVSKLEDVKGVKMKAVGGLLTDIVAGWGGVPVALSAADTYSGLQTGVVEGALANFSQLSTHKLGEVCMYATEVSFGQSVLTILMNADSWARISAKDQAVFDELFEETSIKIVEVDYRFADEGIKALVAEPGKEHIQLATAEKARFFDANRPLFENYVNETRAKGIDIDGFIEALKQSMEKRGYEYPW